METEQLEKELQIWNRLMYMALGAAIALLASSPNDFSFIGIVNLVVPKRFISMKGSTLNLFSWGVGLVQFGANPNFFVDVQYYPEENVPFNIVGYYGMNDWGGARKPQLIIKDIEIANNNNDEITVDNIVF